MILNKKIKKILEREEYIRNTFYSTRSTMQAQEPANGKSMTDSALFITFL